MKLHQLQQLHKQQQQKNKKENKKKNKKKKKNSETINTQKQQYNTWGTFLDQHFAPHVGLGVDILRYARRRMKVFNTFSKEDIQGAKMDFTTALALATRDESTRQLWLKTTHERLVTIQDFTEYL